MSTCTRCGQTIVGVGQRIQGKLYCPNCARILVEEKERVAQSINELKSWISQFTGFGDLPESVSSYLEREIQSQKKKTGGIKATIKYYVLIKNLVINDVGQLPFIINDYYEETRQYLVKVKEIQEKNKTVELKNIEPIKVKINIDNLHKKADTKRKIDYKIEDL